METTRLKSRRNPRKEYLTCRLRNENDTEFVDLVSPSPISIRKRRPLRTLNDQQRPPEPDMGTIYTSTPSQSQPELSDVEEFVISPNPFSSPSSYSPTISIDFHRKISSLVGSPSFSEFKPAISSTQNPISLMEEVRSIVIIDDDNDEDEKEEEDVEDDGSGQKANQDKAEAVNAGSPGNIDFTSEKSIPKEVGPQQARSENADGFAAKEKESKLFGCRLCRDGKYYRASEKRKHYKAVHLRNTNLAGQQNVLTRPRRLQLEELKTNSPARLSPGSGRNSLRNARISAAKKKRRTKKRYNENVIGSWTKGHGA